MTSQRGFALIGVISIALVVSLMGAALFSITSIDTQETQIQSAGVRSLALTQGTVEKAFDTKKHPKPQNMNCPPAANDIPEGCTCECNMTQTTSGQGNNNTTTTVIDVVAECSVQINSNGDTIKTKISAQKVISDNQGSGNNNNND
jgi:hypothetical protein